MVRDELVAAGDGGLRRPVDIAYDVVDGPSVHAVKMFVYVISRSLCADV
jgi:hypothetical protein